MNEEQHLPEIVEQASIKLGLRLVLAPNAVLARPDFKKKVADATSVIKIGDSAGSRKFVIILSSAEYPDAVNEAVQRAAAAAANMPQRLARRVLAPIYADRVGGRSYAVYPRYFPFSKNRIVRKLEKLAIEDAVYRWLGEIANATQTTIVDPREIERRFIAPLDYLANETILSDGVRSAAATFLKDAARSDFTPKLIVEHGDLWLGNILSRRRSPLLGGADDFVIIDWGASSPQGYPLYDLIRFFDSTSNDRRKLRRAILRYSVASGIAVGDLELYALAGLGRLGLNRNQFPLERYLSLAEKCAALAHEARFAQQDDGEAG